MAYYENPTFEDRSDPYDWDAAYDADDDALSSALPDAVIDPPMDVEQGLLAAGDNLQNCEAC